MPNDASPEGLLIAGLGSNLNSSVTIHEFSARVRRDGTFTLYLADSYGYWLGVRDSQWASDPWIGTSGGRESGRPARSSSSPMPRSHSPCESRAAQP